ncbi:UDP-N-acetylglucosamine/UDP-glucose/GDP-mannose transporter isoform X1 [Myotis daubentonii]|uniref:UDP-N-acetylglucosamine/UDP-glucose/GDP-mannose transporter isoform X1 n=1 Tax=Myotis daubentonii TaxID=98922 RepID=UPI00287395F9|nr:UDP-N-acetylglucosamine/UDP-glucose/GDP-mannose transporter isoform X1 [Myotis daubentonii]
MTRQANGAGADPAPGRLPPGMAQLLSALFYGTCSFLIVLVNKALLTTYGFPSPIILGIGQMAATIMILYVSKLNKIIHFPDFDKKIPVKLFPLPLLYVGNHISGLSSTSKLSLPMFTVLRKFTIPLTLLLETIVLGKQYPLNIIISVFAIVLGAFIAAGSDLAFNLEGYVFVLLNDIFTAANGVYTKQKMDPQELGQYGVLFYNACFMIVPALILSASTGDLRQVPADVLHRAVQPLQLGADHRRGGSHQERIHCLHWDVSRWRLRFLCVKLHRVKYLHGGGPALLLLNPEQPVEAETACGRRKHPPGFEELDSGSLAAEGLFRPWTWAGLWSKQGEEHLQNAKRTYLARCQASHVAGELRPGKASPAERESRNKPVGNRLSHGVRPLCCPGAAGACEVQGAGRAMAFSPAPRPSWPRSQPRR